MCCDPDGSSAEPRRIRSPTPRTDPRAARLAELGRLLLRLLQPVRHPHLAVHRRCGGEVLLRLFQLVRAPVELAEAEMAVGGQRTHPELFGPDEGRAVVRLS